MSEQTKAFKQRCIMGGFILAAPVVSGICTKFVPAMGIGSFFAMTIITLIGILIAFDDKN